MFISVMAIGCSGVSSPTEERSIASVSKKQKKVDDQCFVEYSQAAGSCNQTAGEDDELFAKCLSPVKQALKKCCKTKGGSKKCAAEAAPISVKTQKAIDDKCFMDYSREAGRCNQNAGDDDTAFTACLTPIKDDLKNCCAENGGSSTCAKDI